jgi:hypothetical protein
MLNYSYFLVPINFIYAHPEISELVSVQNVQGEVKPYQARQFMRLVERYNIKMEREK